MKLELLKGESEESQFSNEEEEDSYYDNQENDEVPSFDKSIPIDWDAPILPEPLSIDRIQTQKFLDKILSCQFWNVSKVKNKRKVETEYNPLKPWTFVPALKRFLFYSSERNPLLDPDRNFYLTEIELCREILFYILGHRRRPISTTEISLFHLSDSCLKSVLTEFENLHDILQDFRNISKELSMDSFSYLRTIGNCLDDFYCHLEEKIGNLHLKYRFNSNLVLSLRVLRQDLRLICDEITILLSWLTTLSGCSFDKVVDDLEFRITSLQFHELSNNLLVKVEKSLMEHLSQRINTFVTFKDSLDFSLPKKLVHLDLDIKKAAANMQKLPFSRKKKINHELIRETDGIDNLFMYYLKKTFTVSHEVLNYAKTDFMLSNRLKKAFNLLLLQDGVLFFDFIERLNDDIESKSIDKRTINIVNSFMNEESIKFNFDFQIGVDRWIATNILCDAINIFSDIFTNENMLKYSALFELLLNLKLSIFRISRSKFNDFQSRIANHLILHFLLGFEAYLMTMVISSHLNSFEFGCRAVDWNDLLRQHDRFLHQIEGKSLTAMKASPLLSSIRKIIKLGLSYTAPEISAFEKEKDFIRNAVEAMVKASPNVSLQLESLKLLFY